MPITLALEDRRWELGAFRFMTSQYLKESLLRPFIGADGLCELHKGVQPYDDAIGGATLVWMDEQDNG